MGSSLVHNEKNQTQNPKTQLATLRNESTATELSLKWTVAEALGGLSAIYLSQIFTLDGAVVETQIV